MNLLPKTVGEFREKSYWDRFFSKRKNEAFEWYGNYMQLCTLLHKYIRAVDNILVIGCGNSRLSADMYDVGIHNITNIDISEIVIKQMSDSNKQRTKMKWLRMDVTQLEFVDGQFSVVLDKGTVDALFTGNEEQIVCLVEKMFDEIEKVLKVGGRFVCISLLQEHILDKILSWFLGRGWMVRICRSLGDNTSDKETAKPPESFNFPVFMVVCTKFRKMLQNEMILEAALYSEKVQRIGIDEIKQAVQTLQQAAFLKYQISNRIVTGENVTFDLFVEDNAIPRYSLFVVDRRSSNSSKKFAVFIVPQGRETEWLFGSMSGQQQLAENAAYERLIIVHLNRNHQYDGLDAVKAELSTKIMELAPPGLNQKSVVPFLSIGDNLGERWVIYKGASVLSGDFIVEDVKGDDHQMFRRLIFLNNPNVIQSEAKLIPEKSCSTRKSRKNKKKKWVVDFSYLGCQHHVYMIASQVFLSNFGFRPGSNAITKCLIIGLGGGGLPSFMHQTFPALLLDVVEIDSSIFDLAKECFGFCPDNRLKVFINDGLRHIDNVHEATYDIIMLDVDSKDTSIGMSCPPKDFVESDVLIKFKNILIDKGVFVLNLVCRDDALRHKVLDLVSQTFTCSYSYKIKDEVNEIVYGLKGVERETNDLFPNLSVNLRCLNNAIKERHGSISEDLIEVEVMMNSLTILTH